MNKHFVPSGIRFGFLARSLLLSLGCLLVAPTARLQAESYTQAYLATSNDTPNQIEAISLQATATQVSPPQITITTYAAGTYTISRKDPSVDTWTQVATGVVLAALGTWTDTNVTVGTMYEYQFVNTASTPSRGIYATGYILAGIQVDQTQPKGMMAVIVASDLRSLSRPNMPSTRLISWPMAGRCGRFRCRDVPILTPLLAMAQFPRSMSLRAARAQ